MAAKSSEEPQCTEVVVSASVGGKVTQIKFDLSADYHFSETRKYSVPEGWTEEQVEEFKLDKAVEVYKAVDELGQAAYEDLVDQSQVFNAEGRYTG